MYTSSAGPSPAAAPARQSVSSRSAGARSSVTSGISDRIGSECHTSPKGRVGGQPVSATRRWPLSYRRFPHVQRLMQGSVRAARVRCRCRRYALTQFNYYIIYRCSITHILSIDHITSSTAHSLASLIKVAFDSFSRLVFLI